MQVIGTLEKEVSDMKTIMQQMVGVIQTLVSRNNDITSNEKEKINEVIENVDKHSKEKPQTNELNGEKENENVNTDANERTNTKTDENENVPENDKEVVETNVHE